MECDTMDPIGEFEHAHGDLTKLALAIGAELRDERGEPREISGPTRREVLALLEKLRDELLHHFADEEEGLFPFVRRVVPAKAEVVDRLESAHDAICGAVVRLAHLASHEAYGQLIVLYERFEEAYAKHSRDEAGLFSELAGALGAEERAELAALLRGILHR
jgi:hypothetical protein